MKKRYIIPTCIGIRICSAEIILANSTLDRMGGYQQTVGESGSMDNADPRDWGIGFAGSQGEDDDWFFGKPETWFEED